MRKLLILSLVLLLNGCAGVVANHVAVWWTAHKIAVVEVGVAAGALTQVEQLGLTTKRVVEEVKK